MGESSDTPLKLQFDRRVRLDFRGATITSDAGLLACPELDAALGLTETANDYIHESRTGRNVQHPLYDTRGLQHRRSSTGGGSREGSGIDVFNRMTYSYTT